MAKTIAEIETFTWRDFDDAVDVLVHDLGSLDRRFCNIYGIPRGGLVLAVALSHRLGLPLVVDRVGVASNTLVVDDISDSGQTLMPFRGITIATIHVVRTTHARPDFYVKVREADWVTYPWENRKEATVGQSKS